MRSLAFALCVIVSAAGMNGCSSQHKPSYQELETENEELHGKLSAALEHVEDVENHLTDLKNEIEAAQTEASAYRACEDAESNAGTADTYADDVQASLDEAKNALE